MPPDPPLVPGADVPAADGPELSLEYLQQLVALYLALAYGTDHDLHPSEERAITQLARRWAPEADPDRVRIVVAAATAAARQGLDGAPEELARDLAGVLSPGLRRQVLADLGHLAKADGWLSLREATLIGRVRAIWEGNPDP